MLLFLDDHVLLNSFFEAIMHFGLLSCDQEADVLYNSLLVHFPQLDLIELLFEFLHALAVVHNAHHLFGVVGNYFPQKQLSLVFAFLVDLVPLVQILVCLLHFNHLSLDDEMFVNMAGPCAFARANLAQPISHCTTLFLVGIIGTAAGLVTAEFAVKT